MKNFVLSLIVGTSLLIAEEAPFQCTEKLPLTEEKQSQFFYLSGGLITLLPTVSVGYQKVYGAFGSDLSVSGSFFPGFRAFGGRVSGTAIPSIQYKQLFFRESKLYFGLKTGFYWSGSGALAPDYSSVDLGIVTGRQINRKKGKDFFEVGLSPFVYSFKESYSPKKGLQNGKFSMLPIFSISYGIMI